MLLPVFQQSTTMSKDVVIRIENLSKLYRLGLVSTGTMAHDLNRFWAKVRGKDDPFLKIGETNDRSSKGGSDYVWALKDINLEVKRGDRIGIIGKNGAGKSTLLKILSEVTGPTSGRIKMKGRIGALLEVGTGFHPELTGRENIYMNGTILGMSHREVSKKLDEIVDFAGVERYIDTPVKRYSSGMMVRLGFAVAAHLEPDILIVDEVLAVGDAEFQKKAIGKMQEVSEDHGRTILFVSHNMQAIRSLCNKGVLITNGSISKTGGMNEVVDYYMDENVKGVTNSNFIEINNSHRLIEVTKEFEIISVERLSPYLIDVTTPLEFKLRIKSSSNKKSAQVIALIDNIENGGLRVGLTFSETLTIPKDSSMFEVKVLIKNHNSSRGKYIMDFWVVSGDVLSGIKYYDAVYDTLAFEVESYKGKYINSWNSYWGNNCYTDTKFEIKSI